MQVSWAALPAPAGRPVRPGAARSRWMVAATQLKGSGCCCRAKEPHFPEKLSPCARQGLSARPAQKTQEDRVLPQVAAAQVCDGLKGVGAPPGPGAGQGSTPAFRNRRSAAP